MSSSSSPVLVLDLPPSWLHLLPAGVLLITGTVTPLLLAVAPWARGLLFLVSVGLVGMTLWRSGYSQSMRRLISLSWQQNQEWRLQFAVGESISAVLSDRSWRSPWLMCLKFRDAMGKSHQIMVWRTALSVSAWQQWQLRLRLEAGRSPIDALAEPLH